MNLSIEELKGRVRAANDRFEALRLREEITAFMGSPEFRRLEQRERDRVEDLLVEVIAKQDQFKGCDPLRGTFGD
jgi:hypothetical protein